MDAASDATQQLVGGLSGHAVRQRHAVPAAARFAGAEVRLGSPDRRLPRSLRDVRVHLPRDAVPGTDASTRIHRRTIHRCLLPVPGITSTADRSMLPPG